MKKNIPDLYFKATGDDMENPTFQFNVEKVLDFSNKLEKGKIKYLEIIKKKYYEHLSKKFEESIRSFPSPDEKIKSDHQLIIESKFFRAINKRIGQLEKLGEDVIIENSFSKVLERLAEQENNYIKEMEKVFILTFDVLEMKKKLDSLKSDKEKIIYLFFLKKEFSEMRYYSVSNQFQMIKKYKLEEDCYFFEKGKVIGSGSLTFNELLTKNIFPYLEDNLKKLNYVDSKEFWLNFNLSLTDKKDIKSNSKNDLKVNKKNIDSVIKIKWFGSEPQVENLIEFLKTNNLISVQRTDCMINLHFEISEVGQIINNGLETYKNKLISFSKVRWNGTESQFEYLIELLKNKKLITKHNIYSLINKHFENKDGNSFNFSQAKQNRENSKSGKPKNAEIIDEFFNDF